ncbi:MAG: sulfatase, partial [Phycisphaerae bacterium]
MTTVVIPVVWAMTLAGCRPDGERAAARPDPATLPNIVLVTLDTVRADHCSCYGYGRDTTPRMDAVARQGVLFEKAYAVMPTTGPSHATLFTSLYPDQHGVRRNAQTLANGVTTLAEILRANGYETAAFVSSFALERRFGMAQGFETYDDDFRGADCSVRALGAGEWEMLPRGEEFDRRAKETTARAVKWVEKRSGRSPFFLWVHYFDP